MIALDAKPYIAHVFANLWQRGVEELAGLGLTPEQGAEMAMRFALADESRAYLADGVPVCVFGAVGGATWFQATDDFDKHHVGITQAISDLSAKGEYTIYSQLVHPKAERWFNRMGFVRDDWQGQTVTGRQIYRFVRRA